MVSENDLCDIYRIRNPDTRRFTWRRKTPFKQRRLDYFLVFDNPSRNNKICRNYPVSTIRSFSDKSNIFSVAMKSQEGDHIGNSITL